MRVAVADVGTNSCHLLVAESRGGGYRVLDALKERTRLGECVEDGLITPEGVARLEVALRRFKQLSQAAEVSALRVYATSAMREAANGEDVARHLRTSTGVYPQIVSGEREGALTYLGAASSVEFGDDNVLLDLGGGSLEIARGDARGARSVVSLPLGSVRTRLAYLRKDPPSTSSVRELAALVRGALLPHEATFALSEGTRVIGSSGTFESVASMLAARDGHGGRDVNGYTFRLAELVDLHEEIRKLGVPKRAKFPGLDPRRADIIVAGLTVLRAALETLGADVVTVSSGALREGMLAEYLSQEAEWEAGLSARQRSVLEVAERFRLDLAHARHVTRLARDLLAALEETGETFGPDARSLLTSGAMLHEVGLIVGQSSHHKHGQYIVRHAGLRGYEPWQVEIVSQLVRYHRKSVPKASHADFTALPDAHRQLVSRLAAVLRVADGLDRSHTQAARLEGLARRGRGWVLRVADVTDLDLHGVREKADLWTQTLGELDVEAAGA
ncbi:Ppx/GppA phosphatase family protein [Deinococcus pimensis]|uniref:Ppx/GppA phosphatase family protein n=1 Tax=Deinococcus pimensis TaxID=309888 RepID=UPI000484B2F1|nr:Ppx/GppA phosphatase family protein [Deinococcus pimensis]